MIIIRKIFAAISLLLAFELVASTANGQKFSAEFVVNYGSYKMSEVKDFQKSVNDSFPIQVKTMSLFPSYIGYAGNITYAIARFKAGLFWSFNSTGSRLSYSDYSGSFEYNQHAKIKQFGFRGEFKIFRNISPRWEPFLDSELGFGKTAFSLDEKFTLFDQVLVSENLAFGSRHVTLTPGVGIRRYLLKRFFICASAAYLFDKAKNLKYSEDKNQFLTDSNNKPINVDWSGYRLNLTAGVRF